MNDSRIQETANISQQEEAGPFIQRCPHDKENPYALINRNLIRNSSLSPACKWFLTYLLSFDKNWKIKVPYICADQNISKDLIYKYLNESIREGYIQRNTYNFKGLKRFSYFVSETPKYKKCLPCLEKPDTEKPDTENPDSYEITISTKEQYKENITKKETPSYAGLTFFLLEKMKKINPDFSDSTKTWDKTWKTLLNKRDESRLKEIIEWVFTSDDFWMKVIVSPHGLNKNLSKIEAKMNADKLNLSGKSKANTPENDKALAEKIFKATRPNANIQLGVDYIEFVAGMASKTLKFGEKRFKENCIIELGKRKLNINIE